MDEQIINQCSIGDPVIRKLFEEGEFEQLLQNCSGKEDIASLLYKAIALFELGRYEEGAEAYIAYIDHNDVFEQLGDTGVTTMCAIFESLSEKNLQKFNALLDETLQNMESLKVTDALPEFLNMYKATRSVVDKANQRCNSQAYTPAMALICRKTTQFAQNLLTFTQSVSTIIVDIDTQTKNALFNFATETGGNENTEAIALFKKDAKYQQFLILLYPACYEMINLSMGYGDFTEYIEELKQLSQKHIKNIHEMLTAKNSVKNPKTGAITYSVVLGYDSQKRREAINFLGDAITLAQKIDPEFIAPAIPPLSDPTPKPTQASTPAQPTSSGGCYVATAVYGSYDCPQVWTLRRYRDNILAETWYGRAFIRTYYAISPTIVKWFGHTEWFKKLWKIRLDALVQRLQHEGVADTPYSDKTW